MNVLIIEDDDILRDIFAEQLESDEIKVFKASNGLDALLIIDVENIDVIFCDEQMPVMNGMEFLRIYRSRSNSGKIFIVSGGGDYTPNELIEAGADGYFNKPVRIDMIIEQINLYKKCI